MAETSRKRFFQDDTAITKRSKKENEVEYILKEFEDRSWAKELIALASYEPSSVDASSLMERMQTSLLPVICRGIVADLEGMPREAKPQLRKSIPQRKTDPTFCLSKLSFASPRCTGTIEYYAEDETFVFRSESDRRSWYTEVPCSQIKNFLRIPLEERKLDQIVFVLLYPIDPAFSSKKEITEIIVNVKFSDSFQFQLGSSKSSKFDSEEVFEKMSDMTRLGACTEDASENQNVPCVYKINQGSLFLMKSGIAFSPSPFMFIPRDKCLSFRIDNEAGRYFDITLKHTGGVLSLSMAPKACEQLVQAYFTEKEEDKENKIESATCDLLSEDDEDFHPEGGNGTETDFTTDEEEEEEEEEIEEDSEDEEDEDEEREDDLEETEVEEESIEKSIKPNQSKQTSISSFFAITETKDQNSDSEKTEDMDETESEDEE